MKTLFVLISIVYTTFPVLQTPAGADQLIRVDRAFSNLSKQRGVRHAFLQYIDDQGVLLRKDHYPLIGQDAKAIIQKMNDSSFTLTWEPSHAYIAKSGDLGYTFGVYTGQVKDTSFQGTYVTIWKRQSDGGWKFVLDTGNEGVGTSR